MLEIRRQFERKKEAGLLHSVQISGFFYMTFRLTIANCSRPPCLPRGSHFRLLCRHFRLLCRPILRLTTLRCHLQVATLLMAAATLIPRCSCRQWTTLGLHRTTAHKTASLKMCVQDWSQTTLRMTEKKGKFSHLTKIDVTCLIFKFSQN